MNILITGAKGFVGRNLIENLKTIRDGKDRTRPDLRIDALYEYDLGNTPEELDAFCADCDFVFNLAGVNRPKDPKEFIAGRWAAKEAFSKALGTGMCAECAFVEIEVLSDERGKPFVKLYAATAETAKRLGITRIHVSISHERELATAFVVLETADGTAQDNKEAKP